MRFAPCMLAIGASCALAVAQQSKPTSPSQPQQPASPRSPGQPYEEVEQGFEDLGPLGESLETPMLDLRVPTGFERVYRTPDGMLMRIDGAIHAVFPRSEYVMTRMGAIPVVPAGTVFHLGAPRAWETDDAGAPRPSAASSLRIDNRLSVRLAPPMAGAPNEPRADPTPAPARTTIMSSEAYRRKRMAAILTDALEAAEGAPKRPAPPPAPDEGG